MNLVWFFALFSAVVGIDLNDFELSGKQSTEMRQLMLRPLIRNVKKVSPAATRTGRETVEVDTPMGRVRGVVSSTVRKNISYSAFFGIRYAQPPVGELRFRAPVPADPWKGTYDATFERPFCMQSEDPDREDEDCLFLNVYVPRLRCNEPLPVMVFVHGGGFVGGSSSSSMYSPDFIVDTGVILVTFNYRLGALGFLSMQSREIPGNAGLKDQTLAFRWVKDNIRSFGGDPTKVTVFGESAGAASIHYHILFERSKGLFQRAIMESGSANSPWAFESGETAKNKAVSLAKKLGCWTFTDQMTLDCLMKKSPKDIVAKQGDTLTLWDIFRARPLSFVPTQEPIVEGAFVTDAPHNLLKKAPINPVPSIIGSNSREGLIVWPVFKKIDPIGFLTWLIGWDLSNFFLHPGVNSLSFQKKRMIHDRLKDFYFGVGSAEQTTLGNIIDLITDACFAVPLQFASAALANESNPVYDYVFAYDGPYGLYKLSIGLEGEEGVAHADELGYLFYNEEVHHYPVRDREDKVLKAEATVERMIKMWSNFAKFGDPTPSTNELLYQKWQPRKTSNLTYLTIGDDLLVRGREYKTLIERMTFWRDLIAEVES